jgi:N-acetylglutamate synthase-like GNAT family acetyltransferase
VHIVGPSLDARAECEQVLRSLPMWFGIEEALQMYANDTLTQPTFAARKGGKIVGFVSLKEHFAQAWEIHCIAVHAASRNAGIGRALVTHVQAWLAAKNVTLLQVKTVAATSPSKAYAQTREFYSHLGFQPLEVFPLLWAPQNPCLQLIKWLPDCKPV